MSCNLHSHIAVEHRYTSSKELSERDTSAVAAASGQHHSGVGIRVFLTLDRLDRSVEHRYLEAENCGL